MIHALRPWLSIAPTLSEPPLPCPSNERALTPPELPPSPPDQATHCHCPRPAELPEDLDAAARSLSAPPRDLLLALGPELTVPLAAALLILRERQTLLSALSALSSASCDVLAISAAMATALLRLELSELGAASDLTALEGAPRAWTWLSWRSGADSITVVSRGRAVRAQRLRPDPRMAYLHGFLSAAECEHIIALGRNGGTLHPSRVVNYAGEVGTISTARTSESCRVSACNDVVVMRAVQRAAYLTGLSPAHAEAVQVCHPYPATPHTRTSTSPSALAGGASRTHSKPEPAAARSIGLFQLRS